MGFRITGDVTIEFPEWDSSPQPSADSSPQPDEKPDTHESTETVELTGADFELIEGGGYDEDGYYTALWIAFCSNDASVKINVDAHPNGSTRDWAVEAVNCKFRENDLDFDFGEPPPDLD